MEPDLDSLLEQLNMERAQLQVPAIVYVVLLMAFGIIGNLLVLYIYYY
jgi:hypothetical protein